MGSYMYSGMGSGGLICTSKSWDWASNTELACYNTTLSAQLTVVGSVRVWIAGLPLKPLYVLL